MARGKCCVANLSSNLKDSNQIQTQRDLQRLSHAPMLTWQSVLTGLRPFPQGRGPVCRLCQHHRVSLPLWSSQYSLAGPHISSWNPICKSRSFSTVSERLELRWPARMSGPCMARFYHTEILHSCWRLRTVQEATISGLCLIFFPLKDCGTFFISLNDRFSASSNPLLSSSPCLLETT